MYGIFDSEGGQRTFRWQIYWAFTNMYMLLLAEFMKKIYCDYEI